MKIHRQYLFLSVKVTDMLSQNVRRDKWNLGITKGEN